jgi:energy-coupling factor transporter ATP-binding protein EcfA2
MTDHAKKPMRIVSLTAENVKKIVAVHIVPDGSLVQITGANGSGKSSVLDCIWWALAGKSVIEAQPVRQGAESATIRLDMGSLIVTREFNADGATSLIVESAEGARYPSPQRMLDALLGSLSFDPLAFMEKDAKGQLAELRRLVTLDVDLDLLDGQNAADYQNRTDVNRRVKALEQKVATYAGGLAEGDVDPVDTTSLLKAMETASETNAEIEREKTRRRTAGDSIAKGYAEAKRLRAEADRLIEQAKGLELDTDEAEKAFVALSPIEEPVDVSALRQSVEEATRENSRRSLQRTQRANHAGAVAELETAQAEADELTRRIDERTAQKTAAISAATMPVAGLGFGDGMVMFNGLPLEQASSAEALKVSLAIGMAMNPELRVILIKQGSLLDERSVLTVAEWAEANDYQVWMERVDTSGKVGIVMQDGTARVAGADEPSPVEG